MFENVIGYDFIKSELRMFYDLIANREKYKKLGIDSSKNVYLKNILIEGPCGTGKTTIVKDFMNAVADKIKTYFVVRDNHDGAFVEEINDIFRQAKDSENGALIVFDDLNMFQINGDNEPLVAVKTGIDLCSDSDKIFCLATCNDTDNFDGAFMRRWKVLEMPHPSFSDGRKIIEYYLSKHPFADSFNVDDIHHMLSHCSCYELQNLIDSASLYSAYAGKDNVDMDDIKQALINKLFDMNSINENSENGEYETILHECSHAAIMELIEPGSCGYVAIAPKGTREGGVTFSCSRSNRRPHAVITAIAAKVGVELLTGKVASGCQSDIGNAIKNIRDGIVRNAILGIENCSVLCRDEDSENLKFKVENAVHSELQRYITLVRKIFMDGDNLEFIKALANALGSKRILLFSDIQEIRSHFELKTYEI